MTLLAVYAALCECRAKSAVDWEDAFEARLARAGLQLDDNDENARYRGMTALHWACYFYDAAACRYLLGRSADGGVDVNALAYAHSIPTSNDPESYRTNIDRMAYDPYSPGPPPRVVRVRGATPLIIAATIGNLEIVEMLIEAKADVRVEERGSFDSALAHAADGCHFDLMMPLLRAGAGVTPSGVGCDFFAVRNALKRGAPDDIIFEMACRAYPNGGFRHPDFVVSPVRFAALLAALRCHEPLSSDISEELNYPGAQAEVEELTTQLAAAFKQYRKRFRGEHGIKPADPYDHFSDVDDDGGGGGGGGDDAH
jgi:hypothetical protein